MVPNKKKESNTYSLILMRDDYGVRTMRLHGVWFKIAVLFIIALIAVSAAGIYSTKYMLDIYQFYSEENAELKKTLHTQKMELERLQNIDNIPVPGGRSSTQAQAAASTADGTAPAGVTLTVGDLTALLGQAPATAIGTNPATGTLDTPEAAKHPVRIANLKTVTESPSRMRISFDLNNQNSRLTLLGRCSVYAITRQRALVPLRPESRGVMSFQIARYRRMESTFILPDSITAQDVVKIQVTAQANDFPLYTRTFNIQD